ncbi:SAM-dependent methyltransferase [Actinopolyspora saharensis]|uniref:S-adenosyl methyltransferase n=1 Tax=Actinopolyspora saharensis TaxID=995062 RepID=A0A1H1A793_9ACTN|nr:SAM-dependent methyltransferase [Actinopolyspora saharensis]SDQ35527.1 S-adenosyl methyltransferase [Actinopolyspora saharensis]
MPEISRTAPESAPLKSGEVDMTTPSAARAYDYYLGGNSNFPVDREFGDQVLEHVPFVRDFARTNRAFLRRAVTWLCERGVDQFLDIGSGIPTVGNVHEIAQQADPRARTVYVDHEPVAAAHASTILDRTDPDRARTDVLRGDLRDPAGILASPVTTDLIDFSRPVGLLIVATMHFIGPGDNPAELMARYRDALPAGSHLVLSHLTLDDVPEQLREQGRDLERMYARTPNPGYFRDRAEVTALLDGYEIVAPGLVWAPEWHPEHEQPSDPATTATLAAVGRKP